MASQKELVAVIKNSCYSDIMYTSKFNIFRVTSSYDRDIRTIGYFLHEEDAQALKNLDEFGGGIDKIEVYPSLHSFFAEKDSYTAAEMRRADVCEEAVQEILKARAFAKLTPEERAALGMKE